MGRRSWIGATILFCAITSTVYAQSLRSETVASGLNAPLLVTAAPGDTSRLFVLEKGGLARIVKDRGILPTPFLDLSTEVSTAAERGLVGMVFHPNYATNGRFYVYYVNTSGTIVLARYVVSSDPNEADVSSATILTTIAHPVFSYHYGGMLAFSPIDHFLYVAVGDGGGTNDLLNNAQNIGKRLGKILRFDVGAAGDDFSTPASNPFVGQLGADPSVWAYGLRNPWRFSFDRATGDLYIGDVGQDAREEIDFQAAGSAGGLNFGWNIAEGFACLGGSGDCGTTNSAFTPPIVDYSHNGSGSSVIGGYVYRGAAIPGLQGTYFYADFIRNTIWSLRYDSGGVSEQRDRTAELTPSDTPLRGISSFGEDAGGEIYFCDFGGGRVFKIEVRNPADPATDINADGSTDALDIQSVINAALGGDTVGGKADVNSDGDINAVDIQMVVNSALGA